MRRKELKEVLRVIQNYHAINIISYLAGNKNPLMNFELVFILGEARLNLRVQILKLIMNNAFTFKRSRVLLNNQS